MTDLQAAHDHLAPRLGDLGARSIAMDDTYLVVVISDDLEVTVAYPALTHSRGPGYSVFVWVCANNEWTIKATNYHAQDRNLELGELLDGIILLIARAKAKPLSWLDSMNLTNAPWIELLRSRFYRSR